MRPSLQAEQQIYEQACDRFPYKRYTVNEVLKVQAKRQRYIDDHRAGWFIILADGMRLLGRYDTRGLAASGLERLRAGVDHELARGAYLEYREKG